MNSENIITLAELGLSGDKSALVNYIQELAADSANKNRTKLYNGLSQVLEKNSVHNSVSFSSEASMKNLSEDGEELWFSSNMRRKLDRVTATLSSTQLPLKYKQRFNKLLLYGPPGSGKTTIGHYIATALNRPIEYVKISDVISFKFGETLKNLAGAFEKNSKAVIFIDEFDAFAKSRFDSNDVGELKRIVNSLIQTLDVLAGERIVIVATNLKDEIDPAILRRFPLKLNVPDLNKAERAELIEFMLSRSAVTTTLSKKERSIMEDTFIALNLKTVDAIKNLFDATTLQALINKKTEIHFVDFIETMLSDGILDKAAVKKIQDHSAATMKFVLDALAKKYSKIEIAGFMGMHRNSVSNYGQ